MNSRERHYSKWLYIGKFFKNRWGLFIALAAASIILALPLPQPVEIGEQVLELTPEGKNMLAVLVAFVIIFATEALPMGLTVAFVYAAIVFLKILQPEEVGKMFSHDAAWFLVGALMIAQVLVKHNIHIRILKIILRLIGGKTRNLILGIVAFCAITAAFISDHIVAALMLPIGVAIVQMSGGYRKVPNLAKALMFAIAFGALAGGIGTPSGGGRNVVMIGFLEQFFGVSLGYGAWMLMVLPLTLILIPVIAFVILKIFPPEVSDLTQPLARIRQELGERSLTFSQWMVFGIFGLVLLLWITKSSLGIGMIALFGALLFYVFGLAKWSDYQKINWGVAMLYFGAIGMGTALVKTGAASWLGGNILNLINPFVSSNSLAIVGIQSVLMAFVTQFMGDGAAIAAMGPILLESTRFSGIDPVIGGVSLAISSAFAYVLIIGTPANAIVYGSGFLKARDFFKIGLLLAIISIFLLVVTISIWWVGILNVGVEGFH